MALTPSLWLAKTRFVEFGWIALAVTDQGLWRLEMLEKPGDFEQRYRPYQGSPDAAEAGLASEAVRQVDDYLTGRRTCFDLPVDWQGMPVFQRQVLEVTIGIRYGEVLTYGEVARRIGKPTATRAVGAALGSNPVAIVIPCHRVVGSDHRLHGFGAPGGINTKAWLLRMEGHQFSNGRILTGQQALF